MIEHPLWIVEFVNAVLGPPVAKILGLLGFHVTGPEVIPNYLVMTMLIVAGVTIMSLVMRSRLSVEHPSKFQIVLEDGVLAGVGLFWGRIWPPRGPFFPLFSPVGPFLLFCQHSGLVAGLIAPPRKIKFTA